VSPDWAVPPASPPWVPVAGSDSRFPVHRIYCVGRNFAEHAREMGATVERGRPTFFSKPADAIVIDGVVPYPSATADLHHEVEMVVAIGRDAGGVVEREAAEALVFGYAVGLDLTRRDLQAEMKAKSLPWDIAKGFDASAPVSAIVPVAGRMHPRSERLWLEVEGSIRQQASLDDLVWPVADVLHELSKLFGLRAGDLVFMGTPAGVAALSPGQGFRAGLDGWITFEGRIA
jgi:fumarylpyruvate hydrolase